MLHLTAQPLDRGPSGRKLVVELARFWLAAATGFVDGRSRRSDNRWWATRYGTGSLSPSCKSTACDPHARRGPSTFAHAQPHHVHTASAVARAPRSTEGALRTVITRLLWTAAASAAHACLDGGVKMSGRSLGDVEHLADDRRCSALPKPTKTDRCIRE
jgi:hypothetical protein